MKFSKRRLGGGGGLFTALIAALTICGALPSLGLAAQAQGDPPFNPATFAVGFEKVADGFERPVQVVDPGDGSGRLFVVEQGGKIFILLNGTAQPEPFLDISSKVSTGSEQGLLSMAFHPSFATNGTFFIDYTDVDGNTQIERWNVSKEDPNRADAGTVKTILSVDQPFPNHNGGLLLFGPDKYLYIGLGDGGSEGDPNGNGQNLGTLLAKILRIDVDTTTGNLPYGIPADNPYVNRADARPETWLYGLRNPWRFSFDPKNGDLYIGDVGQNIYEEIDIFPAGSSGRNFGWSLMEGPTCFKPENCDETGLQMPIYSYSHDFGGCSVTGGYVYRGEQVPTLEGVYLFADYCSGLLWGMGLDANGKWVASAPMSTEFNVSSFGEDASGELYVVDLNGGIYRVTAPQ